MTKVLAAFLTAAFLMFINAFAGGVEGLIFPVVDRATITSTQAVDLTATRIHGRSYKRRNCTFVRLEWYVGNRDANVLVDVVFEEGSHLRPSGEMAFGPWLLHLTPRQMADTSFAVVYHRCHPFWLTRTSFF